ncbi:hypothetical protein CAPI_06170 [Corynebacterium capitovis DSM 44611]|uniref:hypothetical protein n=1 Tax=Corynebacterium capitovis TaxID=131081 RepID=UPI00036DEE75|nr:hypothetical protein [Corynebacterium capitovis]WKD57778.1 hypothetical protein CAPI_06170 [Corynebacterium capitovis DSM 44611]
MRINRHRTRVGIGAVVAAAVVACAWAQPHVTAQVAPQVPKLPSVDDVLSDIQATLPQVPGAPTLPNLPTQPSSQTPPGFEGIALPPLLAAKPLALPEIAGLDFAPPGPIPGMGTPFGGTYTVQTDSTALKGNVKLSYITLDTAQGPKPAIRIDADQVILDNLRVRFPSSVAGIPDQWQRSGPGKITTLTGNFHIIVASMSVTPQIAGVTLPIPISVSADMAGDDIGRALKQIGAGMPDVLSDQMVMLNGTMEAYYISANELKASPGTTISS